MWDRADYSFFVLFLSEQVQPRPWLCKRSAHLTAYLLHRLEHSPTRPVRCLLILFATNYFLPTSTLVISQYPSACLFSTCSACCSGNIPNFFTPPFLQFRGGKKNKCKERLSYRKSQLCIYVHYIHLKFKRISFFIIK